MDGYLEIGTFVYLKTDPDQLPRIVTSIIVNSFGVQYELASSENKTWHYPIEISLEKNILMTSTN